MPVLSCLPHPGVSIPGGAFRSEAWSGQPAADTGRLGLLSTGGLCVAPGCGVARPEGLEPPTSWSEARRSIQLSYGRKDRRC